MVNAGTLSPFLRNLESHVDLSKIDEDAILHLPVSTAVYKSSTVVVRQDHATDGCLVIVSGYAGAMKFTREGARQIVALYLPGDGINLQQLSYPAPDCSVVALSKLELAAIPCKDLLALKGTHPAIERALDAQLVLETSILREWMLSIGQREALARLAHLLCELGLRIKAAGLSYEYGDSLPLTQEILADCIGVTTVHLNRMSRRLEQEGLVKRVGRTFSVPDWKALRDAGDFNSSYLYLNPSRFAEAA